MSELPPGLEPSAKLDFGSVQVLISGKSWNFYNLRGKLFFVVVFIEQI